MQRKDHIVDFGYYGWEEQTNMAHREWIDAVVVKCKASLHELRCCRQNQIKIHQTPTVLNPGPNVQWGHHVGDYKETHGSAKIHHI